MSSSSTESTASTVVMDLETCISALDMLESEGISLPILMTSVIHHSASLAATHPDEIAALVSHTPRVIEGLRAAEATEEYTTACVFSLAEAMYANEVVILTQPEAYLRFNAANATEEALKDATVERIGGTMKTLAPHLWSLLGRLLAADEALVRERLRKRTKQAEREKEKEPRGPIRRRGVEVEIEDVEMGDVRPDDGDREWEDVEDEAGGGQDSADLPENHPEQLEERDRKIIEIKSIVCMSIALQSTNSQCNAFQSSTGMFMHSAGVADIPLEFLSRVGVTISPKAIQNGITSISKKRDRAARTLGQSGLCLYAWDNLDIDFKPAHPTAERNGDTLAHITTATAIPLHPDIKLEDLDCGREVWERSPYYHPALHHISVLGSTLAPSATPVTSMPTAPTVIESGTPSLPADSSPSTPAPRKITLADLTKIHEETGPVPPHGLLRRGRYNTNKLMSDLFDFGPEPLRALKRKLEVPEVVEEIPLTATKQVPLHAIDKNPNTAATNGEVIKDACAQTGVGEGDGLKDLGNIASLLSGDLLTLERLRALKQSRSEEKTPWRRLQNTVPVMGLFHFKMACADAIWRTFILPKAAKDDPNCVLEQVGQIRPKETGKIHSSPTFRQLHEVIQHVGICLRLEAWLAKVKAKHPGVLSLEDWVEKFNPTFEEIMKLSQELARDFVSSPSELSKLRFTRAEERDLQYENMLLQQELFLLYEETVYAMNMGDIGRLETCFLPWAFIFQGCGKHKYANELYLYLKNVLFIYPPGLRKAVRYSILINPTGKRGKWRGIDWLVEHNNLYIKRIFGGKSSNRSKAKMIKESALIEVYKTVRAQFEDMYCLNQRTTSHTPPSMKNTFRRLRAHMQENRYHVFIRGRKSSYHAQDMMSKGMAIAMSKRLEAVFSDAMDVDSEWAGLGDDMEVGEDGGDLEV